MLTPVYCGPPTTRTNSASTQSAGYSAGGGLSAALTLTVRDKGGPRLLGQLLMCPMLDDRNDSASAMQMDGTEFWNRSYNLFGWRSLLGDVQGGTDVQQYAAPARATDLTGLPPAFLDVGSAECLRDEILAYAGRIWQADSIFAGQMPFLLIFEVPPAGIEPATHGLGNRCSIP
jgi:hypothetical protein